MRKSNYFKLGLKMIGRISDLYKEEAASSLLYLDRGGNGLWDTVRSFLDNILPSSLCIITRSLRRLSFSWLEVKYSMKLTPADTLYDCWAEREYDLATHGAKLDLLCVFSGQMPRYSINSPSCCLPSMFVLCMYTHMCVCVFEQSMC